MVRYQSIINRLGNKENDIKYFKNFLPQNINIIIEPFGGTFAVSRCFYKKLPKNYEYHINDLDPDLFYVYTHVDDFCNIVKELNEIYVKDYEPNFLRREFKTYVEHFDMQDEMKIFILRNKFIRGCMYKHQKSDFDPIQKDLLLNSKITNFDYKVIFNEYKDKQDAFLFLDPPYLFSDNSQYSSQRSDNDMTDIIVEIYEFMKTCQCKVMLIVNRLKILDWLFEDMIKGEYTRIYQLSKKACQHLIITNY